MEKLKCIKCKKEAKLSAIMIPSESDNPAVKEEYFVAVVCYKCKSCGFAWVLDEHIEDAGWRAAGPQNHECLQKQDGKIMVACTRAPINIVTDSNGDIERNIVLEERPIEK